MHVNLSSRATFLGLAALCTGLFATGAVAHDDDPKILDRKAPVSSQGFRSALPGGMNAGASLFATTAAGTGFSSNNVQLLSWIPLNLIDNAGSGNDCWGYTSPSGTEIAIICTSSGTAFFDITNPGNPNQIGYVNGPNSDWRDVKVFSTYAYIVSEGGGGIQIANLSNVDNGQVTLAGSVTTGGGTATHNVAINEESGYLYRTGGGSEGLRFYDLNANPTNPPYVGEWATKYVHDAQVVSYTSGPYAGKEVAFCCSGFNGGFSQTGLSIVDVTNKSNPIVMSEAFYPNPAYSHQGWLTEDRTRFYLGDELDEDGSLTTRTHVINVTDLDNPVVEPFFTNGNQAIGHNMYTLDGLLYQANYTSGLRVFDYAANPGNPQEVAFFDTVTGSDADSFNGLWSVYPYFESGIIVGSDIERGLFLWYVGDAPIELAVVGGAPEIWSPSGDTLDVTITEMAPGDLVQGSAALVYDIGAGPVTVPLTLVSGNQYTVNLPSVPCGTTIAWYITAQSQGGLSWSAPSGAPSTVFTSTSAVFLNTAASYDMESTDGWVSGAAGDNATTGIWTRGNPNGSAAQPEDDNTASGTDCWFTGQAAPGSSVGTNDIDGGTTTLLSPVQDLSAAGGATVSYWRWYVNNGNGSVDDSLFVDISDDGGSTWTNVETLAPGNPQASGGWFQNSFSVGDFVSLTAQVQLRFRAGDLGSGSIVEAAIDDFLVSEVDCNGGMQNYCGPAVINSSTFPATITGVGSIVASDNNLTLVASDMPLNQFAFFLGGTDTDTIMNPGGSMGTLCLGGSLARFNQASQIGFTGTTGSIDLVLDLTSIPTNPNQAAMAGQTWYFQCWFRDVFLGTNTANFTDGLQVTFE